MDPASALSEVSMKSKGGGEETGTARPPFQTCRLEEVGPLLSVVRDGCNGQSSISNAVIDESNRCLLDGAGRMVGNHGSWTSPMLSLNA